MGIVLRFIIWLGQQVWRYGRRAIDAVIRWVRNNWSRVQRWLEQGIAWGTILQWILQILGLA